MKQQCLPTPVVRTDIPAELDYIPAPLLIMPDNVLVDTTLPDGTALFYQNANYRKYHDLAYDYTLLLKVVKGELPPESIRKPKSE